MPFHNIHQRRNDYSCQYRNRQISDKARGKKQNCHHCNRCCNRNCLRLSVKLLIHRSSGNTSIYRAAACKRRDNISCCTGQNFFIIINFVTIFCCKIILRKQSFGHNNNCNHQASACRVA